MRCAASLFFGESQHFDVHFTDRGLTQTVRRTLCIQLLAQAKKVSLQRYDTTEARVGANLR